MLSRTLFRLARHDLTSSVVRWVFAHAAWILPVKRVASTPAVIAFHHPRPSWETHILLVPKVGIPSLLEVDPADEPVVLDVLRLADRIGRDITATDPGQRPLSLIVNGGAYQDVGQLHFHLVAGPSVQQYRCPGVSPPDLMVDSASIVAFRHPNPIRETHLVLRPSPDPAQPGSITEAQVQAVLATTRSLVRQFDLAATGFSLVAGSGEDGLDHACFHLVSGKRL